ncbi:MAG: hypothetical protein IAF08_08850 [Rhizobacter sp.]|nr:hypothetical protein [Chlorobiales bacterium]
MSSDPQRLDRLKSLLPSLLKLFSEQQSNTATQTGAANATGAAMDAATDEIYLVDVQIRGTAGTEVVEIFVDTDKGISLDWCHRLSRWLSEWMDASAEVEQMFTGEFRLEVSSPGVARPLMLSRQYPKNIGRRLKVKFKDAEGNYQTVEGKLVAAEPAHIHLAVTATTKDKSAAKSRGKMAAAEMIDIALDQVVEAKVQLQW